jgi:beta-galactosidase
MGKRIHYYFNYSGAEARPAYLHEAGTNLTDGKTISANGVLVLAPWDVAIVEEK